MKNNYEDLIHLPHHVSPSRPQMPRIDRAAQFSPFAALSGFDAAIEETGRQTEAKAEWDESVQQILNIKLRMLKERIADRPEVKITYFRPDGRKAGGSYATVAGCIKKIDETELMIQMQSGAKIPIEDLSEIEGDLFSSLDESAN